MFGIKSPVLLRRDTRRRGRSLTFAAVGLLLAPALAGAASPPLGITKVTSSVRGSDGTLYTATNHLVSPAAKERRQEWVLVWSGAVESTSPDFLAVVNATQGSPNYGKVVNTVTLGPTLGNEPHHVQYAWHKGDRVYAGGIISDMVYVFDVSRLPQVRLAGVNTALDTPCGSAPDAFQVLRDGTVYGTYMGGPNVSGPCTYTDGQVRDGNGFAGSPGEIAHFNQQGATLAEAPAAPAAGESAAICADVPALPQPSCANPHGIGVREDLNRMVTSDFTEIRNLLAPNADSNDIRLLRNSVRTYDISNRNDPRLLSVSYLPDGPRDDSQLPIAEENRMIMETATTHQPRHRGAFASSMSGGAVYYTPDITATQPQWREIYDVTAAFRSFDNTGTLVGELSGPGWLQVSPDDRFLFQAVMGADPRPAPEVSTGMIYVLDIQKLLAAGNQTRCQIDNLQEVAEGGAEPDCPALVDTLPIKGGFGEGQTNVGPHWGAMDNFRRGVDGLYRETQDVRRLVTSNYMVLGIGMDGDHKVCMTNFNPQTGLTLDTAFKDEVLGTPCVDFNRTTWPHGAAGAARPHGVLFAVADADVR
jgi:hypothetical protein